MVCVIRQGPVAGGNSAARLVLRNTFSKVDESAGSEFRPRRCEKKAVIPWLFPRRSAQADAAADDDVEVVSEASATCGVPAVLGVQVVLPGSGSVAAAGAICFCCSLMASRKAFTHQPLTWTRQSRYSACLPGLMPALKPAPRKHIFSKNLI